MAAKRGLLALFLSGILGACAAGGPLEPPDSRRAVESDLVAVDGSPLAVSNWQAEEPNAIILALHGYGDYAESTFAEAGKYWASAGLTTVAYDQRGFGRNTSRSFWPGADGLIADLKSVARDLRRKYPCKSLILLGHSMGGGVALAASPELDVDGLILAAPAIWGGEELNPFHRLAAWIAATAVPDTRFTGEGVVRIQASDNIEMLRELGRDPLYLRPPSAREIWGLVRITDMAEAASIDMRVPALLLLGEKDQIVPKRAVRRVFNQGDGPRQVVVYPEGWHLLFRDLQAETVWEDVANWIAKVPRPSSCDQPAG